MECTNKVISIIAELNGVKDICPEHELTKDLALDSLQMVMLLIMIEDGFNITLDEADMNPFDLITVKQVIELVKKYTGGDNDA